jgi:hypothetical protein
MRVVTFNMEVACVSLGYHAFVSAERAGFDFGFGHIIFGLSAVAQVARYAFTPKIPRSSVCRFLNSKIRL